MSITIPPCIAHSAASARQRPDSDGNAPNSASTSHPSAAGLECPRRVDPAIPPIADEWPQWVDGCHRGQAQSASHERSFIRQADYSILQ